MNSGERPRASDPSALADGLVQRMQRVLLDDFRGRALCTATFFVLALVLALKLTFLNDEGLFTFSAARAFWHEPWAVLFLHKFKPLGVLAYAIPSRFDLMPFLVAHVIVGSATIWLTCMAASRLGIRNPNTAGWFLATSSIFAIGVSNGYPNADGAFVVALFLVLYSSERYLTAAFVLGLAPLVRYELGLLAVLFVVIDAYRRKDMRFVAVALCAPVVYALSGAIYRQDMLWAVGSLVDPNRLPAEVKTWSGSYGAAEIAVFLGRSFLANSPLLLVFALLGFDRRSPRASTLFVVAALFYAGLTLIQYAEVMKFATTLRVHLAALPVLALVVAQGLSRMAEVSRRVLPGMQADAVRLVLLAAAIGLVAWQLTCRDCPDGQQHARTHRLISELADAGLYRGQPLYTDIFAAPYDDCAGINEAHMLVNGAIHGELRLQSDAAQLAALERAFGQIGWLFEPKALVLRTDALYVIRDQNRNAPWRDRLEQLGAERVKHRDYFVYFAPGSLPQRAPLP